MTSPLDLARLEHLLTEERDLDTMYAAWEALPALIAMARECLRLREHAEQSLAEAKENIATWMADEKRYRQALESREHWRLLEMGAAARCAELEAELAACKRERDEAQAAYRVLGRTEKMLRDDLIAERDRLRAVAEAAREFVLEGLTMSDKRDMSTKAYGYLNKLRDALADLDAEGT